MGTSKVFKFIRGYLTVRIEGLYLERFLNMAVTRGINFWDIRRLNLTSIELKISTGDYKRLKKVIRKTGSKVTILGKDGLPFFFLQLKRRKMLGIGFAVFIMLTLVLSSFIWSVEIIGTQTVNTEEVKHNLQELGVKPGAFKLGLAVSDIENDMLIRMSSLSWIKVKLNGTRADVEIKERTNPPPVVPKDKPCNIVARRDGIITKIVAGRGDVTVAHGDPVKKGQVLVTGVIERQNSETRYVHSKADIKARTWYEGKVAVPLESIEKIRNGRKIINISMILGSKILKLKNTSIPYKSYDKIIKSTKLIDTDKFQLPLEIVLEECFETINKTVTITVEEAKSEAADRVEKLIIDSLPSDAKILNKKINISVKDNVVIANALIETIEDIGVQEEIKINGEV